MYKSIGDVMESFEQKLIETLNRRRRDLDMSPLAISRRSGMHPSTVYRLLNGDLSVASFGTVCRISQALGVVIYIRETDISAMKHQAAKDIAEKIVKTVQATSALEAQAINVNALKVIKDQIVDKLLAGPGSRLWQK